MTDRTIQVTNLLLASLLECGGGQTVEIKSKHRYSMVSVDLEHFNKDALAEKVLRLARVIERTESDEELKHLFSASMLGELEDKYIRLKRRVVRERGDKDART